MAIVADFDLNSQRNDEVKAPYALARHHAGGDSVAERRTSIGSTHKTRDGPASDIDSGNRGLEGDDDGSSKTPVTLVLGEVMATGRGARRSGRKLKRASSPGNLAELTLGPFGTQRNRVMA